jgi:creatinine amidohydrolase
MSESDGILMEMTIEEVRAFRPEVVAIGVGSVEPHGPVLPYGTDYFQCDAVVRGGVQRANRRGARALMYPTLPIGNNVNFKAFPFACRIRVQTLMQVMLDIFAALEDDGIRKIVLYDGHGGNTDTLRAALRAHVDAHRPNQGAFVCITDTPAELDRPPLVEHPSNHGGESETSRMLYLRQDLVRTDRFDVFPFGKLAVEALSGGEVHFVRPWHRYVPASAGGDVRHASAEKGRQIIEGSAEQLADLLVQLAQTPWTETFPYREEKQGEK